MKKKVILAALCLSAMGCTTNMRYPNWEYVRIEDKAPDNCVYKMQEPCSAASNECYNWYKQRATKYSANTVVITQSTKDEKASTNAFTGNYNHSTQSSMLADYYACNGSKNILPAAKN